MTNDSGLHAPRPVFAPELFTWLGEGHGAAKLSSSAVAPLVAAARGYLTVTPETVREAAAAFRLGGMTSAAARQLKGAVGDEDAMIMPWVRMDSAFEAARKGHRASASVVQFRPSSPIVNGEGQSAKYVNVSGVPTVLDANPGTPAPWFTDSPAILLTEGIIKGDAVLTALLREHGVSDEVLSHDHDGSVPKARVALREAMETVPAAERVLIVSFVGVANWRQNPEWTAFNLRGRKAWIAYDADVATNRLVWKQAAELFTYLEESKKTGTPHLIQVPPVAGDPKAGLDDFFAALPEDGGGTWADIANHLVDLPDAPSIVDGGAEPGTWRISPDGTSAQESSEVKDPSGRVVSTRWEDRVPIGGRVKSVEIRRAPSDEEIRTGKVGAGVGSEGTPSESSVAGVEIELSWREANHLDKIRTAVVTGPAVILNYQPKDWARNGAEIPTSLLRHPEWPPQQGDKWLKAMKTHRNEETAEKIRWETMGWVPAADGTPVFIVGEQVISSEGRIDGADIIGVDDHLLPGSADFGVAFPETDYDDNPPPDAWLEQAREDLEEVYDIYIRSRAWNDPKVSATVLATALRPALPIPCKTACYFVGRRRSGKSWSAGAIMSFWQPNLNTWSNDRLPGAAKDTVAATENSVSKTVVWVADDLAPSMSRQQAMAEEAALGDLIRSIHNRSGKRRMGPDMRAREVNKPKALLVVTAENEPSVSSVTDRVVMVQFGEDSLNSDRGVTARVVRTWTQNPVTARLTSAFIRWFAWRAEQLEGGWESMYERVEDAKDTARVVAARLIAGKSEVGKAERHAQMASDLMVTYYMLGEFAEQIGCDPDIVRELRGPGLSALVAQQVAAAHDAQALTSPGRSALEAVSTLLRSGRSHISNAERAGDAPTDDPLRNHMLGWVVGSEEGDLRPTGPSIGWLVVKDEAEVVLLDPKMAFNEAQRQFPDLIPYGSKQSTAWASLWDEGLTLSPERGWARKSNGRSVMPTVQVAVGGSRLTGVPIPLEVLLTGQVMVEEPEEITFLPTAGDSELKAA